LHIAAHYGNVGVAKALINAGADSGRAAKHNITPLHVASKWGQLAMVDLLVENGKMDFILDYNKVVCDLIFSC
jgi:ankyrin